MRMANEPESATELLLTVRVSGSLRADEAILAREAPFGGADRRT
jgi:hypothetical protein